MALQVEKGTFNTPAGTGDVTVTTGFVPKALIVWASPVTTSFWGSPRADIQNCIGFGTRRGGSTQQGCASIWSTDAQAASTTRRSRSSTQIVRFLIDDGFVPGQQATLSSFGTTNFVLNFSANTLGVVSYHYIIFGGTDITDAIVLNPLLDSTSATQVITGAGFQPRVLFALDADNPGSTVISSGFNLSFGFASSPTQFQSFAITEDNGSTMTTSMHWNRSFRSDACLERLNIDADSSNARWDLDSFDADGFTLGVIDAPTATDEFATFLLIGGGGWEAGKFAKPITTTGADTIALAETSLTPKGLILFSTKQAAVGIGTGSSTFVLGAATAADGTQTGTTGAYGIESINTTAKQFNSNDSAIETIATSSEDAVATVSNFSAGSFDLNWSVNSGSADLIAYLAIGDNISVVTTLSRSVFDAPTVTESVNAVIKRLPKSVSDASTATDVLTGISLSVSTTLTPNIFDAPTVTESTAVVIKRLVPQVFDAPTATEGAQIVLKRLFVSVSDAPTVTESLTAAIFDTVFIGGFKARRLSYHFFDDEDRREQYGFPVLSLSLSRNDAPLVTESTALSLITRLNLSDSPIITEATTTQYGQLRPEGFDAPTVTDAISTVFTLSKSLNDSPIVTESVSIVLPILYTSRFDNFTTLESAAVSLATSLGIIADTTIVTDAILSLVSSLGIAQNDAPTVTDVVSLVTTLSLSKADQSVVTDSMSLVSALSTSKNDAPIATEAVSPVFTLSIAQNDSSVVTDAAQQVPTPLNNFLSDAPIATDSVSLVYALSIAQNDDATASEALSVVCILRLALSDVQLITDAISFDIEGTQSRSDTSIVTDDADIVLKVLHITEGEDPTVSDGPSVHLSGLAPQPNPADTTQVSDAIFIAIARMEQTRFLWRDDDGDEDGATALAAVSSNIMHEREVTARLRVQIDTVGDTDPSDFQLEFRRVSDGPGGPWTVVT